jgi:hypothetical protein
MAGSFAQLRALIKPGETLTITDTKGERAQGKLSELSTASLVLRVSGKPRQFGPGDIDTIETRVSDPLLNGALIGLAIGWGLAAITGVATSGARDAGPELVGFLAVIYGGVGAGIGVGVDAFVRESRVVYAGTRANQGRVELVPIMSRHRKGLRMSVRFGR